MTEHIVWQPQPRQVLFLERFEDEALYGGAAGGGKSDALLAEAVRQVKNPAYRAVLFRKTYGECSALIDRSHTLYGAAFPQAVYNGTQHVWIFPSGAKIFFGSMQYAKDRLKYQGRQFDFIGFDELTHFTWEEYAYMFSRNRPTGEGTRCYIRATCNPGGIGHGWVKDRFITGKEPGKTYWEEVTVQGKIYRRSRVFIPSTVFDNKILLANDPTYIASLAMLPEAEKKALLYGDWDSFSGQVFTEWRNDSTQYHTHRFTHVIEPFAIPKSWKRFRSFDFGYSKPFSVGWYAQDPDGVIYRYRELYGCTDVPNTGVKWEIKKIAKKIAEIEREGEAGQHVRGIADPAIWDDSRGADGSVAAVMEKYGVYFEKANNHRLAGKMQVHYRLAFDDRGCANFYVFKTCPHFIRTVPNLVYDSIHVEDVDTTQEDHIYDELRYLFMAVPIVKQKIDAAKKPAAFDPLAPDKPYRKGFLRI